MKVEVSAPSNRAKRDFHFEAFVKRVIIYHNDFPQFSKVFYTIVENPIGTITIYRHGETTDDVKAILKLKEDGEMVRL